MTVLFEYPTIPALGELPYKLNDAHQRLLNVYGEGENKQLSDASRIVFQNEVARCTDVFQRAQSMVDRINGGNSAKSDSVDNVRALIVTLQSGIDGLYQIIGNGTVIDWAKNSFDDVGKGAKEAYAKVKEEVAEDLGAVADKVTSFSPFIIIILVLVLGIVLFAGRIGR